MDSSLNQPQTDCELRTEVQQHANARRSSWLVRSVVWICLAIGLIYLDGFQLPAKAVAQCATCRAGGHCAMNQNGTCLANRTFWGYHQGKWRKWPTVAAQEAAAANAPPKQSPASLAPSSVLPSPEDEARTSTPNISSAPSASEESGSNGAPGESPGQGVPRSKLPRETDPLLPQGNKKDPAKDLFPNTTLPDVDDPATKPKPMPKNDSVRPALPGSLLDDPAPTPPVDPNDRVPNLPPNLQGLEPGKEAPSLQDLFPPDETDQPRPPGGAALPQGNQPAEVQQTSVSNDNVEIEASRPGRFANGILGMKPAAANMPSTAGSSLDEMTELERARAEVESISSGSALPHELQSDASEDSSEDKKETSGPKGPDLLLSPEDTTEVKNPLRDEFIHARYAARMFTPQSKSAVKRDAASASRDTLGDASTEVSTINPLRAGSPRKISRTGNVTPVTYEEPVENEPVLPAMTIEEEAKAKITSPLEEAVVEKAKVTEQPPVATKPSVADEPTPAEPMLTPTATELPRENSPAPASLQRKPMPEPESDNALRAKKPWTRAQNLSNPLRAGEATSLPAPAGRTLATGRYSATVAAPGLPSPAEVSPTSQTRSAEVSAPRAETFAPRRDNPLRSGF